MAPDPFKTALSATPMATVFSFLELPPEIRAYIYQYVLTTDHGVWMDVDRRQLPPFWFQNNAMPSVGDIQAAMSPLPIVSPALLRVCKQIYMEARMFLRCNTLNFTRWTNDALWKIPQQIKANLGSAYFRIGVLDLSKWRGNIKNRTVDMELPLLRHFTLGLRDDDPGLIGAPSRPPLDADEREARRAALEIICFHVARLFRKGKLTTFRIECPSTYPSSLYPFVWVWAWVEDCIRSLLPMQAQRTLDPLYVAVVEVLRWSDESAFFNYQPLLENGPVILSTGEDLHGVISRIAQIWEDNGVLVSARDPVGFERGTVITFQRVVTGETDEQQHWGDNELVPKVRRGEPSPNFPLVVDLKRLAPWVDVVVK